MGTFFWCDHDLKFVTNLPHPSDNTIIAANCYALFKGMNNDAVEVQLNRRRLYRCLKPHLLVSSNLKINLSERNGML